MSLRNLLLAVAGLGFSLDAAGLVPGAEPGLAITWDAASARPIFPGGYGRARLLRNGELMLVYSHGPAAWAARSRDCGASWDAPVKVAAHGGWFDTNCELAELNNGWLVYGLNSRPQRENEGRLPYVIRTLISRDGGTTWGDETDAYVGGKSFGDGCWEPAFLELPSGELHLYFANEAPYTHSNEQEITLLRSFDRGLTWGRPERIAFRSGKRDGMPVPLLLRSSGTIVCAIEDDGYNGDFKPVIVRTSLRANWRDGPVRGDSDRRVGALRAEAALPASVYAGAPYLAQFASGEVLLVVQSSEGRSAGRSHSIPAVYVSLAEAKDFHGRTSPFAWLPQEAAGEWNSLTILDESSVLLITTVSGYPPGSPGATLWSVVGRVERSGIRKSD